jgi:cation:H+ antiporter
MSFQSALAVFLVALGISIVSSIVLAKRIDQVGTWLGLSEGLLGLLTALAADTPEIASAVTAIVGGHHDLGFGVVFGSNIFNIAALLGVGALTAGSVRVGIVGLWFDGGTGVAIAIIVAARIFGWVGNIAAVLLVGIVVVPYLCISAIKPEYLERVSLFPRVRFVLQRILLTSAHEKRTDQTAAKPSSIDLLGVVPATVAVVVASIAMVDSAVVLGDHWNVSPVVMGTLVLATLTGIPNMLAAIRLAAHGRGTAVVSETLNSNNVNLLIGALLPAILFGSSMLTAEAALAVWWSIGMTLLALLLASFRSGLTRRDGVILICIYCLFVFVTCVVK